MQSCVRLLTLNNTMQLCECDMLGIVEVGRELFEAYGRRSEVQNKPLYIATLYGLGVS